MAKVVQVRRGTTAALSTVTGAEGELFVDTDKETLTVHNNYQAGGFPLLREDLNNLANGAITPAKIAAGSGNAYKALMVNAAGNAIEYGDKQQVGQVKHVWTGSSQSHAGGNSNYVNATGMSIDITPRSAASRFLVTFHFQGYFDNYGQIRITRNGSGLWTPNNTHGMGNGSGDPYNYISCSYLDHPNTTSAVNYKGQFSAYSSGTVTMNSPANSGTSLYVMELLDYA